MTAPIGMGFAPMGFSLYGYGLPATLPDQDGSILQQSLNGINGDARKIDPFTRDYVMDADGIIVGENAVDQQVFLALMTTQGSSAVASLGSTFSQIKTIDTNTFTRKIESVVQVALNDLIKDGSISLINVSAVVSPNGVGGNINIDYINNLTQQRKQARI